MFKNSFSKKAVLIVVINNELFFILFDPHGGAHISQKVSLDQFLNHTLDYTSIAAELKNKTDSLLILPDHWSGNTVYPFQSEKRSLAKMFIERKLLTEYPDLHDIKHFFDFSFSQTDMQDLRVNVFFLQDPRAFKLYQKLSEINLNPARISTPALLWEQKLIKIIPDVDIGGTCLVHLLSTECFLYFFFKGRLLFSRSITIPDFQREPAENSSDLSLGSPNNSSVLTYEINQSLYLFSQKTKSDVDNIYLLSSDMGNTQLLSDNLGREVTDFGIHIPDVESLQESPGISEYLGPVGSFNTDDLSPSKLHLNLTHGSLKKMLEWKPVQTAGLIVGLILIFLLAMESMFLWKWPHVSRDPMVKNGNMERINQKQIIQQYSEALNQILAEIDCPSPRSVIINIGRSIPDNTWITDMDIETETNPAVSINGMVRVSEAEQLKNTFSILLKNLNRYFRGTRSLSIQDIDFKVDESNVEQAYNNFLFTLKFNLP